MGRHTGAATSRAPPAKAAARILSPAGLQKWWIGGLTIESVDADWPNVGSRMRFRAGGSTFDMEVAQNELPRRLVQRVETRTGPGTITHTFEPTPDGGTRYTKTVESTPRGVLGKLFDPMIGAFVKREVKRAAADAERP